MAKPRRKPLIWDVLLPPNFPKIGGLPCHRISHRITYYFPTANKNVPLRAVHPRFHLNIGDQTGWCAIHFCCSLAALLTLQILGGFQERKPNCFATWQRAACQPSCKKYLSLRRPQMCQISGAWNWIYFCLQRPCCYKFCACFHHWSCLAKAQQKSQMFDVKVIKFFTFASGSKPQSTMSACLAIVFLNIFSAWVQTVNPKMDGFKLF